MYQISISPPATNIATLYTHQISISPPATDIATLYTHQISISAPATDIATLYTHQISISPPATKIATRHHLIPTTFNLHGNIRQARGHHEVAMQSGVKLQQFTTLWQLTKINKTSVFKVAVSFP